MIVNSYNIFNDQENKEEKMEFYDEKDLKSAASDIPIITPENNSNLGPMSGYYPATYGFEDILNGQEHGEWQTGSVSSWAVIEEFNGHRKVYDCYMDRASTTQYFAAGEQDSGTVEFWVANEDATSTFAQCRLSGDNPICQMQIGAGNTFYYADDVAWYDMGVVANNNQWYHIRFDFECTTGGYMGLGQYQWYLYIDGTQFGPYIFSNNETIYRFNLWSNPFSTDRYIDAVGYSWDPNYNIGDNLDNGLLLSFTNTTNLNWIGYSLDYQTNTTIAGNTTIPMKVGPHTIQVFGTDSLGIIHSSDVSHFTYFFNLTGAPIYINDLDPNYNWSKTSLENSWCSGSGTWNDPYIIEYVLIDAQHAGACIDIRNSMYSYFIIRHCELFNAHGGDLAGAIRLGETNNGSLMNNNCSYNGQRDGIVLVWCKNITISGNTLTYNRYGIQLFNGSNNNMIFGNTINNNDNHGILLSYNCNNNTFSGNFIYKHDWYGILISSGCNGNLLFYNSIYNNIIDNALDYGNNQWDNGTIGNYWDDYGGLDVNDDGIGDSPYVLPSAGGGVDNYPIWDDGPHVLLMNSPNPGEVFGVTAPSFNVSISFPIFDTSWYTLDDDPTKYLFIGSTGTINQTAWDTYGDENVTIRFFVNNTVGNFSSAETSVFKDILAPTIEIKYPIIYSVFGEFAPAYILSIEEGNLIKTWYTMDGGIFNTTFTESAGIINQTLWVAIPNGKVTIRFYATDIAGHIGFKDVIVIKDTGKSSEEFPLTIIIIAITSFAGGIIMAGISFILLRRRKLASEII
ncbi:MAG: nitrous oxide reductase family maturation protein NosD [Candidatus Thorarchaeota archaeon]